MVECINSPFQSLSRLTTVGHSILPDELHLTVLMCSGNDLLGTQAIKQIEERGASFAEMVETEIA